MKNTFILEVSKIAQKNYDKYKILPSLCISQSILESNWGKSAPGNNIFGIKKGSSWKGKVREVVTHEHLDGKKVKTTAYFRVYDSIEESIIDYLKLLQISRYKKVPGEKNYKKACEEIRLAGYATDPNYSKKLVNLIEQYKLYLFDTPKQSNEKKLSQWSLSARNWGEKNKITDNTRMLEFATREEVITMLYRYELLKKESNF